MRGGAENPGGDSFIIQEPSNPHTVPHPKWMSDVSKWAASLIEVPGVYMESLCRTDFQIIYIVCKMNS